VEEKVDVRYPVTIPECDILKYEDNKGEKHNFIEFIACTFSEFLPTHVQYADTYQMPNSEKSSVISSADTRVIHVKSKAWKT
jgi:hypothetical protein